MSVGRVLLLLGPCEEEEEEEGKDGRSSGAVTEFRAPAITAHAGWRLPWLGFVLLTTVS